RHQSIKEHFTFWDKDKYAALTLKVIATLTTELTVIKAELQLTDNDFPQFLHEECAYLESLKELPVKDNLCICYVEVLASLMNDSLRADWDLAHEATNNTLTKIPTSSLRQINQVLMAAHVGVDSSYAKLQHVEVLVAHIEVQLSIDTQWEIGGKEYNHFKDEALLSKYHVALDELEQLVIMRLFELLKLSLSSIGKFGLMCSPVLIYSFRL
ncbi:hypothetical protein BDR05DRAFT_881957, partial [Suillus weaverae]